MSSFNLAKKLLPAKKGWKSFKITFHSKFQKLRTSTAIKRTKYYCIKTLSKIRALIPQKFHALIRHSPRHSRHDFHSYYHQRYMIRKSSSAIYVDELFPGHASMHNASHHRSLAQPAKSTEMVAWSSSAGNLAKGENPSTNLDLERQHHKITAPGVKIFEKKGLPRQGFETSTSPVDGRKIPLLPLQLGCVDERAEEFISKFRLEMKLEREQSIIDFQEMLARST